MDPGRHQAAGAEREIDPLVSALQGAGLTAFEYDPGTCSFSFLGGAATPLRPGSSAELHLDDVLALTEEQDRPTLQRSLSNAVLHGDGLDVILSIQQHNGGSSRLGMLGRVGSGQKLAGVVFDASGRPDEQGRLSVAGGRASSSRDLDHRLANVFPLILTLVRMTAENHSEGAQLAVTLQHRIRALALTYRLLARRHPTLEEIVRLQLAPFDAKDRVTVAGPAITLKGGMAESFAIITHELASNAATHGALKSEAGRIDVTWDAVGKGEMSQVLFEWTETGGPPAALGARAGFGANVLGFEGPPIVGSRATIQATEDGLRYTLALQVELDAVRLGNDLRP